MGSLARVEFSVVEDNGGGQKLVTHRRSFVVKGVLKETGNLLYDNMVAVSTPSANTLLKKATKFNAIYVLTRDGSANDFVENEVSRMYGNDIGVTTPRSIMRTVETVLAGFRVFVFSIGSVTHSWSRWYRDYIIHVGHGEDQRNWNFEGYRLFKH